MRCIHAVLAQRARRSPFRAAVIDDTGYVTFGALQRAVERRAAALAARAARPGARIGVLLPNDTQRLVTYLGCLTAGLVYTPLSLHPAAVLERILESLACDLVVTAAPLADHLPTSRHERLLIEDLTDARAARHPPPVTDPHRTAHLLHTSGTSTGTPRTIETDHVGSMLSHAWRMRRWPYAADDVVGCNIFDVWDLVPALWRGVPAVMLSDDTMRDPRALAAAIRRYAITRLMMTPTLLGACLTDDAAARALGRLRLLVLCGETITRTVIAAAATRLPRVRIVNLYSLAETHDVAGGELVPGLARMAGRVADFADVHVVAPDDRERPLPTGEVGRVLVGGAALARGYVDPVLDRAGFPRLALPGAGGATVRCRVYDTGDLGVLHDDGELEIVGRHDESIKVRGAWAAPVHVEDVLASCPGVAGACVLRDADARGNPRLSAYAVPEAGAGDVSVGALRRYLAARLQALERPGRIFVVPALPLLPSGKVDRARLAREPPAAAVATPKPADRLTRAIARAFADVLEVDRVAADGDFFAAGGDSLAVIVLAGCVEQHTGYRIAVDDLREHPTPAGLAGFLDARVATDDRTPWTLPSLDVAIGADPGRAVTGTVLVTGATGSLGACLVHHLLETTSLHVAVLVRAGDGEAARRRIEAALAPLGAPRAERLRAVPGDLGLPRLGLDAGAFDALSEVDAIVHAGAAVDMFAPHSRLEKVNVSGTREVLRLAAKRGARFVLVSSSAVLPLDGRTVHAGDVTGARALGALSGALERSGADGYALSKHAAEHLAWQAAAAGLAVAVVRIPHVLGHGEQRHRLPMTATACMAARVFPAGDWSWQFVAADHVCRAIVAQVAGAQDAAVRHVALPPMPAARIAETLRTVADAPLDVVPLPAFAAAVACAARSRVGAPRQREAVTVLAQLIAEHGPRAAASLADATLAGPDVADRDPRGVLERSLLLE